MNFLRNIYLFTVPRSLHTGEVLHLIHLPFPISIQILSVNGAMVNALVYYRGGQSSIPRQDEIFINLKCSLTLRG